MGKIYLIKSDNDGYITYKIGKTTRNVQNRINEMQTGNPGKLSLEYEFETPYYDKLESILHGVYQMERVQGEWFSDNVTKENFIRDCKYYNDMIIKLKTNGNPFI